MTRSVTRERTMARTTKTVPADGDRCRTLGESSRDPEARPSLKAALGSERIWRMLVETASDGFWLLDAQFRTVFVNPAIEQMLGFTCEEMVGHAWDSFGDAEWMARAKMLEERRVAGVKEPHEFLFIRKDGSKVLTRIATTPLYDDTGEFDGALGIVSDITEQKETGEAALRMSEERYRLLFDRATDGILVLTTEGRIVAANESFARMHGYTVSEMGSMSLKDLDTPASSERVGERMRRLLAGESLTFEVEHVKKDGGIFPLEVAASLITSSSGDALIQAFHRDITERREAERALVAMQSLVAKAGELGMVGGWELDIETAQTVWTKAVYDIYELEFGQPTTLASGVSFYTPASRPIIERAVQRAIAQGEPFDVELEIITAKGNLRTVHAIGEADLARGKVSGFFQDITASTHAAEELRDSEERFRGLFEHLMSGFALHEVVVDDAGRPVDYIFLELNEEFEKQTGLLREAVIGKRATEVMPGIENDPADWINTYGQVALTGEALHFERFAEPLSKWYHVTVYRPQQNQFATIFEDITGRKQAEATRAALQAQLAQAQKMESVGLLAGGVAHDFNNMLGVILGTAELAIAQVDAALPLHEDLQEIRKAAVRSADLTRQLLAFARQQTIAPVVLDLNETVPGMLAMLQRLIGEDISLHWQPTVALWPVMMDRSQMDQILTNLCVNARHAIADVGTVAIATANMVADAAFCAQHAEAVPGDYVRLSVRDTGCGMDEATLARIFEPFFTTRGGAGGTGLGLATVYGAVKQNQGFVTVASALGEGTTFEIYLPRHVGAPTPARHTGPVAADHRGGETILLVEDEPSLIRLITKALEAQGYVVLAANSAADALRLATAYPDNIHLLVSDVVMPEMNGRDLATALLKLRPMLKPLFMSGYTADIIATRGLLAPGVALIEKPFAPVALAAKVREVLDGQ